MAQIREIRYIDGGWSLFINGTKTGAPLTTAAHWAGANSVALDQNVPANTQVNARGGTDTYVVRPTLAQSITITDTLVSNGEFNVLKFEGVSVVTVALTAGDIVVTLANSKTITVSASALATTKFQVGDGALLTSAEFEAAHTTGFTAETVTTPEEANTVDASTQTGARLISTGDNNDVIKAGKGNDQINAGLGDDTIDLSAGGADEVVYDFGADGKAVGGGDTITSFKRGEDKLILKEAEVATTTAKTIAAFLTSVDGTNANSFDDDLFIVTPNYELDSTVFYITGVTFNFREAGVYSGGKISSGLLNVTFATRITWANFLTEIGGIGEIDLNLFALKNPSKLIDLLGADSIALQQAPDAETTGTVTVSADTDDTSVNIHGLVFTLKSDAANANAQTRIGLMNTNTTAGEINFNTETNELNIKYDTTAGVSDTFAGLLTWLKGNSVVTDNFVVTTGAGYVATADTTMVIVRVGNTVKFSLVTTPAATTPIIGTTLTADTSGVSDGDDDTLTFAYQWKLAGSDITGATAKTYTTIAAGEHSVTVTATDDVKNVDTDITSANFTVVTPDVPTTGTVMIDYADTAAPIGSPNVGEVLTAVTSGITDGNDDTLTFTYQWKKVGSDTVIGTEKTYIPSAVGDYTVTVIATDSVKSVNTPFTSEAEEVVEAADIPTTGTVTIDPAETSAPTDKTNTGEVLTAVTTGLTDMDDSALTFTYQWKKVGSDTVVGTAKTYTPTAVGHYTVTVIAIDDVKNVNTPFTSAAEEVVAVEDIPTMGNVFIMHAEASPPTNAANTGEVLTAVTTGLTDTDDDTLVFTYQWKKVGSDTVIGTEKTYIPSAVGDYTVKVTAIDSVRNVGTAFTSPNFEVVVRVVDVTTTGAVTVSVPFSINIHGLVFTVKEGGSANAQTMIGFGNFAGTDFAALFGSNSLIIKYNPANALQNTLVEMLTFLKTQSAVTDNFVVTTGANYVATASSAPLDTLNNGGNGYSVFTLSNTPFIGVTLTAVTSGLTDTDDSTLTFSYQWQVGGVNVATGGTAKTYTPTAIGAYTVTVTAFDDVKNVDTDFTSATAIMVETADVATTGTVSIMHTEASTPAGPNVGEVLTAITSGLSDTDDAALTFTYQWQVGGVNVATDGSFGGTGATYTPTAAGEYSVTVTAIDDLKNVNTAFTSVDLTVATTTNIAPMGEVTVSSSSTARSVNIAGLVLTARGGATSVTFKNANAGPIVTFSNGNLSVEYNSSNGNYNRLSNVLTNILRGRSASVNNFTFSTTADYNGGASSTLLDGRFGASTTYTLGQSPPAVGDTLTADATGIVDANGLTGVTFSYQWLRSGDIISGATAITYTLVADDVGKSLTVRVSYTDENGTAESVTSINTDSVTLGGVKITYAETSAPTDEPNIGEVLTAVTSGLSDADDSTLTFTYQWKLAGVNIPGATLEVYTPTAAGEYSVVVTATDSVKNVSKTFTSTITVSPLPDVPTTGTVSIIHADTSSPVNAPNTDEVLTAVTTALTDTDDSDLTFTYQWLRNGADINGATASTYTPTLTGEYRVAVTAIDDVKNVNTPFTSEAITVSGRTNSPTTGSPRITYAETSTPRDAVNVGEVLTADTSTIVDADDSSLDFAYQWRLGGVNIPGETTKTYTPTEAGEYSVRVSARDSVRGGGSVFVPMAITVIAAGPDSVTTGTVMITHADTSAPDATPNTGEVLTAVMTNFIDTDDSALTFTYQWKVGGVNVATGGGTDGTDATYTPTEAGEYSVIVTAIDDVKNVNTPFTATAITVVAASDAVTAGAVTVTVTNGGTLAINIHGLLFTSKLGEAVTKVAFGNVTNAGFGGIFSNKRLIINYNATKATENTIGEIFALLQTKTAVTSRFVVTKGEGYDETASSTVLDTLNNGAGSLSVYSVFNLAESPTFGAMLTAVTTGLSDADDATLTFTYQWKLAGSDITGATAKTYTPTVVGAYTVVVTAIDDVINVNTPFTSTAQTVVAAPIFLTEAIGYKVLAGTNGRDTLANGIQNTIIYGLGDKDTINTGAGKSVVIGGADKDVINVGSGAATIVQLFSSSATILAGEVGGGDTINGFWRGIDKLVFVDTDTSSAIRNVKAFETAFGASSGSKIFYVGGVGTTEGKIITLQIQLKVSSSISSSITINFDKTNPSNLMDISSIAGKTSGGSVITDSSLLSDLFGTGSFNVVVEADLGFALTPPPPTINVAGYKVLLGNADANTLSDTTSTEDLFIQGAGGNDIISAGSRNNVIIGGTGTDTITLKSGTGTDIIVHRFTSGGDTDWTNYDNPDGIHRFQRGVDKLVFVDTDSTPITDLADFLANLEASDFEGKVELSGGKITVLLIRFGSGHQASLRISFDRSDGDANLQTYADVSSNFNANRLLTNYEFLADLFGANSFDVVAEGNLGTVIVRNSGALLDMSGFTEFKSGEGAAGDTLDASAKAGKQLIQGGALGDTITASTHGDIIAGGTGADTIKLVQGGAATTVVHRFASSGNEWTNSDGADTINDFLRGTDKFVLVDIDRTPLTLSVPEVPEVPAVKATVTSNGLTYTADTAGVAGNAITVTLVYGSQHGTGIASNGVTVSGNAITVNLKVNGSVSSVVANAINTNTDAALLIDASAGGAGITIGTVTLSGGASVTSAIPAEVAGAADFIAGLKVANIEVRVESFPAMGQSGSFNDKIHKVRIKFGTDTNELIINFSGEAGGTKLRTAASVSTGLTQEGTAGNSIVHKVTNFDILDELFGANGFDVVAEDYLGVTIL